MCSFLWRWRWKDSSISIEQSMSKFISPLRLIVVEDLLDNNAMLWKMFKSVNEEETNIIDWLMKWVLMKSNVSLNIEKRWGGIRCQISFTGIEYSLGQTSVDPLGEGVKKISSIVFDEEERKTSILFLTGRRVESESWSKSLEETFSILTNKQMSPLIDVDLILTVYPWTLEMDQSSPWKRREICTFESVDRGKGRCSLLFNHFLRQIRSTSIDDDECDEDLGNILCAFIEIETIANQSSFIQLETHSDWISIRRIVHWSIIGKMSWRLMWRMNLSMHSGTASVHPPSLSSSASSKSN